MRTRLVPLLAAAILAGAARPSHALDPASADILDLRLGMDEPQVAAVLARQGIPPNRIVRKAATCADDRACNTIITITTADGTMTLTLQQPAADHDKPASVSEIIYAFRGWGSDEPQAIAESVLERFGRPNRPQPMMWCHHPGSDHHCPPQEPTLRFTPDKLVLVLSSGAAGR
jgi:hypothetical protein